MFIALAMFGMLASTPGATAPSAPPSAMAAASASVRAVAITELNSAARHARRAASAVVASPGGLLQNLDWQFAVGDLKAKVRKVRELGLTSAAKAGDALLRRERARVDFAHFLHRAEVYGRDVAQKAHQDNPQLTPGGLGAIADNASAWFGNSTIQRNTITAARKVGRKTYEMTLSSARDLDEAAYKVYRGMGVGARKTSIRYQGREGRHRLPDRAGGMNGGVIGFRRAAETSGGTSPAVDLNTQELGNVKIHFVR